MNTENFSIGDTVEVYCPTLGSTKYREKIKSIEGNFLIFEGNSGKIQRWFCTKI